MCHPGKQWFYTNKRYQQIDKSCFQRWIICVHVIAYTHRKWSHSHLILTPVVEPALLNGLRINHYDITFKEKHQCMLLATLQIILVILFKNGNCKREDKKGR